MNRRGSIIAIRLAVLIAAATSGAIQAEGPTDGTDGWKGTGNVTETRCQGMMRGPNCITHADRKAAAARGRAARAAADPADTGPDGDTQPQGGPPERGQQQ